RRHGSQTNVLLREPWPEHRRHIDDHRIPRPETEPVTLTKSRRGHDRRRQYGREERWRVERLKNVSTGCKTERCDRRGDERRDGRGDERRNRRNRSNLHRMLSRWGDPSGLEPGTLSRSANYHPTDGGEYCEEHRNASLNFHEPSQNQHST